MKRSLALMSVGLLAVAGSVAGASAASAADPAEILVSTDGATYTTTLAGGLFDDIGLLVPQDSESKSLWIKNPLNTSVSMRVSVSDIMTSSAEWAESVTLTSERAGGIPTTELFTDLDKCDVIVPITAIAAGATVRVDFAIDMLDVDNVVAQNQTGSLDFKVAMRDGAAGAFPASACDDSGVVVPVVDPPANPGNLAITGAELPTDWLVAAGVMLGFGLLLLVRRRRRSAES
jgi:LPXTG-motif cell wall-anchored protein